MTCRIKYRPDTARRGHPITRVHTRKSVHGRNALKKRTLVKTVQSRQSKTTSFRRHSKQLTRNRIDID